MIALLNGQVAFKSIDHVILDVGGVGYRLHIPLSTFYAIPEEGPVRFHIHTYVREDAIHLYGFLSAQEKELFVLLISVSGIGPRVAVNILSHISAAEFREAIGRGDVKRLSSLPGIGKKTSERLILELSEKVRRLTPITTGSPASESISAAGAVSREDAVSALVNLGYKENQSRKALESLEIKPDSSLEDVLKGVLRILMR